MSEMQRPRASGNLPMAKPKGNSKGKGTAMTSSHAGNICSILFQCQHQRDEPISEQARIALPVYGLCRSLTGWTLHDATTLSDRTH
jgi:hypothetical protein